MLLIDTFVDVEQQCIDFAVQLVLLTLLGFLSLAFLLLLQMVVRMLFAVEFAHAYRCGRICGVHS